MREVYNVMMLFKKIWIKILMSLIIAVFLATGCVATHNGSVASTALQEKLCQSSFYLDGQRRYLENHFIIQEGITLAPLREVFTHLGADISYVAKHGRLLVCVKIAGHNFLLEEGTTIFSYNGLTFSLPLSPVVVEGKFYFPLRFLLEIAGYDLHWQPCSQVHFFSAACQLGTKWEALPSPQFHKPAQRVPVLMYHHLVPAAEHDGSNRAVISAESFEKQMTYLFTQGYRTITLSDLYLFVTGKKDLPPKSLVITFDDGYLSNYVYAYPILKRYRFRAVQFPITAFIDRSGHWLPRLTWEMMERVMDVFEFHGHTHNLHYYRSGSPALLVEEPEKALKDLKLSRELLAAWALSYPFGAYNDAIIELARRAGYRMAFTIEPGHVYPGDDLFRLRRLGVYPETGMDEFAEILRQATGRK